FSSILQVFSCFSLLFSRYSPVFLFYSPGRISTIRFIKGESHGNKSSSGDVIHDFAPYPVLQRYQENRRRSQEKI
ncbi:MAG TPA: hypothetical protein PLN56_09750, partial [Methanoregulaceae archaeon]|nr:hypothetical protein [Methanoregulaceae archaeon]